MCVLNAKKLQGYYHLVILLICLCLMSIVQGTSGCNIQVLDGVTESEGVRFIRLRENAEVGKSVLKLRVPPRTTLALRSTDGDHKYFGLNEINGTTVMITLLKSLEDLVDRDDPKNLLKFRIVCAGKHDKIDSSNHLSITVYIEDVNDNAPEFLNMPYIINVDENTPPGSIVFEGIKAFDRDKPNTPNSEVHFSMSTVPEQLSADGSPYFALKSPHRPLLVLKKQLDYDNGIRLFKLPLFAWDRGTPAFQVNTTIIINVKDVDDLPPKFTEGVYRTKINEFSPITGIPIRVPLYFSPPIMAYDQDSLNVSLAYDIISGNERDLFRVNTNNGIMYLIKEIDLEEESLPGNTFVLQIEARQRDNPIRKSLARIEVEIMDLNDNVPEFEADFYNISIVENLPTHFSVLQVNAVDRDQGENAEFVYHLHEQEKAAGAFRIDSRSGWITVRDDRLLDREKRKSLQLTVRAIEKNSPYQNDRPKKAVPSSSSVEVEITLLDTNDNTPKFENGNLYEFKVPINAKIGYKVGKVLALDPDEGTNGKVLYELQRPKGSGYIPFLLDTQNGTIYVNGPLRRGRIAIFVEASDQPLNPSERRFSLAVITIEVYATIDDQAIDFVGAPYEFWVGSNVPLGTSVGQVRTTLIYEDEEEIMYDLLHTYSEGVPFAIEERSGIITVIRELSEFNRKLYHFEAVANYLFANSSKPLVMARGAQPKAVATSDFADEGVLITNVTIHVIGKHDNKISHRPVIEEINMNIIKFHIEENLVGGIIGQLLYKNGINIVNNNHLGTYRELQTTSKNRSMIRGSRFRSHKERNQNRLQRLPRRLIEDTNIKLRYIIANQQEVLNKISITEDGTLLTVTGLDREVKDRYDLTVIVEYMTGLMSGAGIYQVAVEVEDVNDNPPKFNGITYVGLIKENSNNGKEISMNQLIQVSDADKGHNAMFNIILQGDFSENFAIEHGYWNESMDAPNNSANMFNIFNLTEQWNDELKFEDMQKALMQSTMKSNSGTFYIIKYIGPRGLDREKDQLYDMKLIATDTGGLMGYAHLKILVADVNDNPPIFERISVFKDSQVEIREYTTDMEIYFVDNSAQPNMFASASSTMIVPPYQIPGSPRHGMDMPFTAQRPGSRAYLKARQKRTPHLKSILKCPLFAILEDIPLNTKVLQVTANDEDFGKNAQVHYDISAEHIDKPVGAPLKTGYFGARYFAVNKLTGELSVNHPLLAHADIFLNISATDIDGLKDVTCLRFTVTDVNNHAPTFKKSWYSFDVEEGIYKDSVLGHVLAVDLDYGENANITYSLSEKNIPFHIKSMSGVIKITGSLDREMRDKYSFQVIAMDNAKPLYRMSSTVDIEVNILDVNDNKPEFIGYDDTIKASAFIKDVTDRTQLLPLYKAYIDRNTQIGTYVKQVTAIDKDYLGNGNGLVLYTISQQHPQSPVFQIDSRDGTIITISHFERYNDYEHLNLTVIASDLGNPVLSSTAIILINLQGQSVSERTSSKLDDLLANENYSLFQHQYYELKILENNVAPLDILRVNLTNGLNADKFRWSLFLEEGRDMYSSAQTPFEFDAKSSLIYTLIQFDREQQAIYKLRLRAEKHNRARAIEVFYPVLDERVEDLEHNECRIVLHILDDNDNSPIFRGNGQPIIAVMPRSAAFGYPVTTVVATDADSGINAEVRYRLLNEPSRMFAIDEVTGKIRIVGILPVEERVYGFDVKATDRAGADDGRSSIVNIFVYAIDESKQVRIVVAGKPVDVEKRIDALMSALSDAIQMDVRVRLLEPHNGGLEPSTDAYIYAVDFRSNSIMDMEQLQESLAGLQLDALQIQQQQKQPQVETSKAMPRIIELAEFGQLAPRFPHSTASLVSGLEIIIIVLLSLCGIGALLTAFCFLCMRQKRNGWRQPEFPSAQTGLAYSIARTGMDSCRQHRHQSVSSSAQTQSTAIANQKLDQQIHQLAQQPHFHQQFITHQPEKQRLNESRKYIDVPLPKSVNKLPSGSFYMNPDLMNRNAQFLIKHNSCQSINHLCNNHDTSMFSLQSNNGHDSGVEFLSSRELYDDSANNRISSCRNSKRTKTLDVLCPRHLHGSQRSRSHNRKEGFSSMCSSNGLNATDSSDNYEDSLVNDNALITNNCRNATSLPTCEYTNKHDYQNTQFEKRSCIRHSFSGGRNDDLFHSSPHTSLVPRGHFLRNSMNDLEERLHNLEQSFRRPFELSKSNSVY